MKRLISLISTHGKPPGQAAQEVWEAFQKYQSLRKNSTLKSSNSNSPYTDEERAFLEKYQGFNLPPTQEEYQRLVELEARALEDSSTSETPKTGQPEVVKTYEVSFVPNKPKQPQPVNDPNLAFNQELEKREIFGPKPPEGMQVTFFQKSPEEYKRRMLDHKKSKK